MRQSGRCIHGAARCLCLKKSYYDIFLDNRAVLVVQLEEGLAILMSPS